MENEEENRRINEGIAWRFKKIEDKLKNAGDVAELLEILFEEVEQEFNIPFVWLSLIDDKKAAPIIEAAESSEKLRNRLNLISSELFSELLPNGVKPVLINKELKPYYSFFPFSKKYFVKSMAIVPLQVHNEIIGSWNNGDISAERYSPDMETGFLQKFAELISRRLTELIDADS